MKVRAAIFFLAGALQFASVAEASVEIVSLSLIAYAKDETDPGYLSEVSGPYPAGPFATPYHATVNAEVGGSYSKNEINITQSEKQTVISLGMDHRQAGTSASSYGYTYQYIVRLISDVDTTFDVSGFYKVTDFDEVGDSVVFGASITDPTLIDPAFHNLQMSDSTHNEQFIIGQQGGDLINHLTGNSTGTMLAGVEYAFRADARIVSNATVWQDLDSGASAVGNFTLRIGAVPELSSVAIWGLLSLVGVLGPAYRSRVRLA